MAAPLRDLAGPGCGARLGGVDRELTKPFEEVRRGTLDALALYYEESPPGGEVALVIAGAPPVIVDERAAREKARICFQAKPKFQPSSGQITWKLWQTHLESWHVPLPASGSSDL